MDELAGFGVLFAGSIATLVLVVIGAAVILLAIGRDTTKRKKWVRGISAALIVLLIPTWDEVLGRLYFYRLCSTNSGVAVLKRVELGPEYENAEFPRASWLYEKMPLAAQYPYSMKATENLAGPGRISQVQHSIRDAKTGLVLGTATNYFFRGGWFRNTFSLAPVSGESCNLGREYFKQLLESTFDVTK